MVQRARTFLVGWRRAAFVVVLASILLAVGPHLGAAGNGPTKSAPGEVLVGGITPEEYASQMSALHGQLLKETPAGVLNAPVVISLTDAERSDLQKRQDSPDGPAVVGRTKPLREVVRFSAFDAALISSNPRRVGNGQLQATSDGGFVWAMAVESRGAGAVRVHVGGLDLSDRARLYFFNPEGQAFGPYTRKGPNGDGDFWTNTVFGSKGVLLLHHDGPDAAAELKNISFTVSEVGHVGPRFAQGLTALTESFCSFNVPCIENALCHTGTPADAARNAVALMQWIAGPYIYTCTGGLLNDTVSATQIPYFLTANHCISTSTNASNLETYFQFTLPCGSTSCPQQTQPGGIQRLGATIKTTGTAGDFTLLQLDQTPPAGSFFLGWNNTPITNTNMTLYRVSHPAWAPQAYNRQFVDPSAPTCTGWPRGQRIYSRTDQGGTEGGSSGSPVLNGSSQVVGQLSGACGTNVGNACDYTNNATVDGAFAYYWPSVQPYLDPGSCLGAGSSCTSNAQCCSGACRGGKNKTCR